MPKLLAVGAAVLDCIYLLDELPAAAEKHRAKGLTLQGGGMAATAAVTARRLGVDAALAARVGDGQFGAAIVDELVAEGVDCALVRRCRGRRSSVSAVMIGAEGERMIVNYKDPDMDAGTGWLPERLPAGIDGVLGDHHWQAGTEHVFRLAHEAHKPAILDADRLVTSETILRNATHIGFSARGLREQTGMDSLPEALASLQAKLPGWLAVTDGKDGCWFTGRGEICHAPAPNVVAVDTNGAGDVWHGALAAAILEGQAPGEAVAFANAAASLKCSRPGGRAAIPTRDEVERFLRGINSYAC
jgi:sulfofructose kinase